VEVHFQNAAAAMRAQPETVALSEPLQQILTLRGLERRCGMLSEQAVNQYPLNDRLGL
jgi:hypothetical protein